MGGATIDARSIAASVLDGYEGGTFRHLMPALDLTIIRDDEGPHATHFLIKRAIVAAIAGKSVDIEGLHRERHKDRARAKVVAWITAMAGSVEE